MLATEQKYSSFSNFLCNFDLIFVLKFDLPFFVCGLCVLCLLQENFAHLETGTSLPEDLHVPRAEPLTWQSCFQGFISREELDREATRC